MTPLRKKILVRLVPFAGLATAGMVAVQWWGTLGWEKTLGMASLAGVVTAGVFAAVFWYWESRAPKESEKDQDETPRVPPRYR